VAALWRAGLPRGDASDLLEHHDDMDPALPGPLHNTAALLLLWIVWKSRNRMVFHSVAKTLPALMATVACSEIITKT
jgi:hypothetical protein